MYQINTKYRIEQRELTATLRTIEQAGYDSAFEMALKVSLEQAAQNPECCLATTYLAWSLNLMLDSRIVDVDWNVEHLLMAAHFYRKLAHKIYWFQRKEDLIAPIGGFIQAVK